MSIRDSLFIAGMTERVCTSTREVMKRYQDSVAWLLDNQRLSAILLKTTYALDASALSLVKSSSYCCMFQFVTGGAKRVATLASPKS
jgi:hypothetical protein